MFTAVAINVRLSLVWALRRKVLPWRLAILFFCANAYGDLFFGFSYDHYPQYEQGVQIIEEAYNHSWGALLISDHLSERTPHAMDELYISIYSRRLVYTSPNLTSRIEFRQPFGKSPRLMISDPATLAELAQVHLAAARHQRKVAIELNVREGIRPPDSVILSPTQYFSLIEAETKYEVQYYLARTLRLCTQWLKD